MAPAPRAQQSRPEEVAIALAAAKVRRGVPSPNSAFELTGIRLVEWYLAALLASPKAAVVSSDEARASCWARSSTPAVRQKVSLGRGRAGCMAVRRPLGDGRNRLANH